MALWCTFLASSLPQSRGRHARFSRPRCQHTELRAGPPDGGSPGAPARLERKRPSRAWRSGAASIQLPRPHNGGARGHRAARDCVSPHAALQQADGSRDAAAGCQTARAEPADYHRRRLHCTSTRRRPPPARCSRSVVAQDASASSDHRRRTCSCLVRRSIASPKFTPSKSMKLLTTNENARICLGLGLGFC